MFPKKKMCAGFVIALAAMASNLMSADAPAAPKTLQEQVTYLEGALSESLRLRDLTMLDLAVKGFKASKLAEKDLELSMLRAERNAAWSNAQQYGVAVAQAASMEAWGLMARAKLGNDQALQELRKLADDLPPAPAPLPGMTKDNAADYHAKQVAIAAYEARVKLRGHAMFALALLKEPGIQDKAIAAIESKVITDQQVMMMGFAGETDPLVLAVLEPDINTGFSKLVAYCSDEKYAVKDQAGVLGELNALLIAGAHLGAEDKFSVSAEIRQRLNKDDQKKLAAPYASLMKRYTPDPNKQWDMTLNTISNIGMGFLENALIPDGVDAMEALLKRLPGPKEQYPKANFVAILKRNGKEYAPAANNPKSSNTPVKPPKPPDGTTF